MANTQFFFFYLGLGVGPLSVKKIVASSSTVTPDPNPVCTVLANVRHII